MAPKKRKTERLQAQQQALDSLNARIHPHLTLPPPAEEPVPFTAPPHEELVFLVYKDRRVVCFTMEEMALSMNNVSLPYLAAVTSLEIATFVVDLFTSFRFHLFFYNTSFTLANRRALLQADALLQSCVIHTQGDYIQLQLRGGVAPHRRLLFTPPEEPEPPILLPPRLDALAAIDLNNPKTSLIGASRADAPPQLLVGAAGVGVVELATTACSVVLTGDELTLQTSSLTSRSAAPPLVAVPLADGGVRQVDEQRALDMFVADGNKSAQFPPVRAFFPSVEVEDHDRGTGEGEHPEYGGGFEEIGAARGSTSRSALQPYEAHADAEPDKLVWTRSPPSPAELERQSRARQAQAVAIAQAQLQDAKAAALPAKPQYAVLDVVRQVMREERAAEEIKEMEERQREGMPSRADLEGQASAFIDNIGARREVLITCASLIPYLFARANAANDLSPFLFRLDRPAQCLLTVIRNVQSDNDRGLAFRVSVSKSGAGAKQLWPVLGTRRVKENGTDFDRGGPFVAGRTTHLLLVERLPGRRRWKNFPVELPEYEQGVMERA
ncbi:hypothetical protein JCM10213_000645 [Rhodosporidiobolus nylandii]